LILILYTGFYVLSITRKKERLKWTLNKIRFNSSLLMNIYSKGDFFNNILETSHYLNFWISETKKVLHHFSTFRTSAEKDYKIILKFISEMWCYTLGYGKIKVFLEKSWLPTKFLALSNHVRNLFFCFFERFTCTNIWYFLDHIKRQKQKGTRLGNFYLEHSKFRSTLF